MMDWSVLILLVGLQILATTAQGTCMEDEDCNEAQPCCSGFGYCGSGEGFCTPSTRTGPAGRPPTRRSGAGCSLDETEIVGGDLPVAEGGGGIKLDRSTSDECFNRCDENPGCKWFTYDSKVELCYLKSGRGYLRNRTDGFTSGATFRDGCNQDPACTLPYSYYRHQCMYFSDQYQPWDRNLASARRGLQDSRQLCSNYGGFLPYEYSGFHGSSRLGNMWHWVNYGPEEGGTCWACRPGRWGDGIRAFPCEEQLHFACQRNRQFPLEIPPRPDIIHVPRSSQGDTCSSCQRGRQSGTSSGVGWRGSLRRIRRRRRRKRINPYYLRFLY